MSYSYKLNNSNTVYVSTEYREMVKQYCDESRSDSSIHHSSVNKDTIPLKEGAMVVHQQYGQGTIVNISTGNKIEIQFNKHHKILVFQYPNDFYDGKIKKRF